MARNSSSTTSRSSRWPFYLLTCIRTYKRYSQQRHDVSAAYTITPFSSGPTLPANIPRQTPVPRYLSGLQSRGSDDSQQVGYRRSHNTNPCLDPVHAMSPLSFPVLPTPACMYPLYPLMLTSPTADPGHPVHADTQGICT